MLSISTPARAENAPRAAGSEHRVSLSLLGGFELRIDGEPVALPSSAQRVIAFLGLHPGPLARIFVAGNLWIDASEERAAAALRTALWRLGEAGALLVSCEGRSLRLHPDARLDIDEATRIARQVLDDPGAAVSRSCLASLRNAGELLPDWYDDWILIERERLRQLRLYALEEVCRRCSADGRHAEAAEAGLAAVRSEPLRESAHRALIAAHLAQGNPADALRQYRICRRLMHRDLAVAPSAALDALVEHLWRGDGVVTLAQ